MENISQMSLLEVAVYLMEQKKVKQSIRDLIKEVLEVKGLDDPDGHYATQLYIDITTSSKFVYMGDEEWDLKSRQSLDEYDKDGSAFNSKEVEIEEEAVEEEELDDTLDEEDDEYEDDEYEDEEDEEDDDTLDEEDDEYEDDEYEDEEDEEDDDTLDEEDDEYEDDEYEEDDDAIIDGELTERYSEDDFNEDKYNDLMDDYEDMYEE